jgi:hypothetical protein
MTYCYTKGVIWTKEIEPEGLGRSYGLGPGYIRDLMQESSRELRRSPTLGS